MKYCVLRSMANISAFNNMLTVTLLTPVKCSTPAFGKLQCPIEACPTYFKGCSLSFVTPVVTVLFAVSLNKVPPLRILTFKNV